MFVSTGLGPKPSKPTRDGILSSNDSHHLQVDAVYTTTVLVLLHSKDLECTIYYHTAWILKASSAENDTVSHCARLNLHTCKQKHVHWIDLHMFNCQNIY